MLMLRGTVKLGARAIDLKRVTVSGKNRSADTEVNEVSEVWRKKVRGRGDGNDAA